jgi:hypothetical protein
MKVIASALVALSVLAGVAAPASTLDGRLGTLVSSVFREANTERPIIRAKPRAAGRSSNVSVGSKAPQGGRRVPRRSARRPAVFSLCAQDA